MSRFVTLTIAATLVVLGVLAVGIYRFNMTNDDLYLVSEDGQVVQYDQAIVQDNAQAQVKSEHVAEPELQPHGSEVMRKLFSLDTPDTFTVNLPDGGKPVVLTHFINVKQTEFAMGDYQDGEVKGRVLLDYIRITPLNFESIVDASPEGQAPVPESRFANQTMPFLAPFIVTTQGSGVFWYVGMFSLNYEQKQLHHLGSVLIGDRIEIDSIEPAYPFEAPHKVTVTYKTVAATQPMSAEPKAVNTLVVTVSETGIH